MRVTTRSGVAEYQGVRPSMEDCYVIDSPTCMPGELYAVLDGHGGGEASALCAQNLPRTMCKHIARTPQQGGMLVSMARTFEDLDKQVAAGIATDAGTTCSAALHVGGGDWWTANVGDSAVLWVPDQGNAHMWTTFHRPEDDYERTRIQKSGGLLINYSGLRVRGNRKHLAVSRALGDHSMKYSSKMPYYNAQTTRVKPGSVEDLLVSWVPDVKQHRTDVPGHLVVACDGLWDYVQTDYVTSAIRRGFQGGESPSQLAQRMIETAKAGQTRDNVTALVVRVDIG